MDSQLLQLSHELLHCIFVETDPLTLATLNQTCRTLRDYISSNSILHKDLYLRKYDQPRTPANLDWEKDLHRLEQLGKIMESEEMETKSTHLEFVVNTIQSMLASAPQDYDKSLNLHLLLDYFTNTDNINAFLCASSLFGQVGGEDQHPAPTEELRQASAKLHCLFGVPIDEIPRRSSFHIDRPDHSFSPSLCTRSQTRPLLTHPYARSKVYDLREYTDGTLWGPFKDDGQQRVDWEKVEAIMIVLGFNLRLINRKSDGLLGTLWDTPFIGAAPNSFVSPPTLASSASSTDGESPEEELDEKTLEARELQQKLDAQDPYGVTGTWMRVVCFLDYNDLHHFNFHTQTEPGQPRDPIDTREGMIELEEFLRVTRIEPPDTVVDGDDEDFAGQQDLDWSSFTGERLPVVHFVGSSRSLHSSWDPNANSRIRGTVRQTPEGEIRWTTFSIFHGEERWRSEGIQVGGLRSARGILGNWFDKDYDDHGPAGPTAFWKLTDELLDEKPGAGPSTFF